MAKYTAKIQETCSNGYMYLVEGDTLTDVRKKAIAKFKNGRWHKTADPPICSIRENNGTMYGKEIGRIDIQKWYNFSLPFVFIWKPETNRPPSDERRLVKNNGELGMTMGTFRKIREKEYRFLAGY